MSRSRAVPTVTAALGTCDKYCPKAEQSCWISGRALSRCPVKDLWVLDNDENFTQSEMVKLEFVNQYYWFTSVNKTRKGSILLSCAAQPVGATQTYAEVAKKMKYLGSPESSTTVAYLGYTSAAVTWFPVTDFARHGCVFVMMFVTAGQSVCCSNGSIVWH